MGPSWRVNVITASSLSNTEFAMRAERQFNDDQSGILTNTGGDWLGSYYSQTHPASYRWDNLIYFT